MPRFDLDAYKAEHAAEPYELVWAGKEYRVDAPPWPNMIGFSVEDPGDWSEEDVDRYLSVFFSREDYRRMLDDGLEKNDKYLVMVDVMTYVGENVPKHILETARRERPERTAGANGSRSASRSAPATSASSKPSSSATSDSGRKRR